MPSKQIQSRADLAIHGAAPAFSEALHVGRPNIGSHDVFMQQVDGVLQRSWLTNNGPLVQELEARIASQLGVSHCVAMCNGTIALEIAIRALNLSGEVIVPAWTFVATAHALHWQGIKPVFADIDPVTHCISPESVRAMITPQTTGIIGVHLWGRPAPIEELTQIADEFGLQLIFDAAHAFGCSYTKQKIGRFGSCEVFSFHATKVLNCLEGGAVVTNDDELAETLRLMRNFGFSGYDNVVYPGTNGKLPEINAAMGLTNLDKLSRFVQANQAHHCRYTAVLNEIAGVQILPFDLACTPNYHYVVAILDSCFAEKRNSLIDALHAENIFARRYFWPGCHRMQPYRDLFPHSGLLLPHTEDVARRVIVLPTGHALPPGAIDTIGAIFRLILE